MNSDLFREQALQFRIGQTEGHPRIISAPGAGLVCLLLAAALAAVLSFLCMNDYARKATVTGLIETNRAIKRVYPTRTGRLARIHVSSGDRVQAGDVLARFDVPSSVDDAGRQKMLDEFDGQLSGLARRAANLRDEEVREVSKARQEVGRLGNAMERYAAIIELQQHKVEQLQETREAARPLFEGGTLSRLEWGRFNESVLSAQQYLGQLEADQSARRAEAERVRLSLEQLPLKFEGRRMALDQERSRIRQEIARLSSQRAFAVTAPIGGEVTGVFLQPGDNAAADRPVVSIRPGNARLQAKLLIPSRSAGFAEPGQRVNLLYDAFPYQQFGSYRGRLERLSTHALLPDDAGTGAALREPYFEATVSLEQTWVDAYGERIPLRDGMTLKADIVLDERSLIDWLLEPLLVMRGRSA